MIWHDKEEDEADRTAHDLGREEEKLVGKEEEGVIWRRRLAKLLAIGAEKKRGVRREREEDIGEEGGQGRGGGGDGCLREKRGEDDERGGEGGGGARVRKSIEKKNEGD